MNHFKLNLLRTILISSLVYLSSYAMSEEVDYRDVRDVRVSETTFIEKTDRYNDKISLERIEVPNRYVAWVIAALVGGSAYLLYQAEKINRIEEESRSQQSDSRHHSRQRVAIDDVYYDSGRSNILDYLVRPVRPIARYTPVVYLF